MRWAAEAGSWQPVSRGAEAGLHGAGAWSRAWRLTYPFRVEISERVRYICAVEGRWSPQI
eukprot:1952395-Prymnesium_polylepis.1